MSDEQSRIAFHYRRENFSHEEGQDARNRIPKAFPLGRSFGVRPTPKLDLFVTPPLPRFIFADAGQRAIVALIEGGAPKNRRTRLPYFPQDQFASLDRPRQCRAESRLETDVQSLESPADSLRLFDADGRQRKVSPTSEDVALIAFALPMAGNDQ